MNINEAKSLKSNFMAFTLIYKKKTTTKQQQKKPFNLTKCKFGSF